MSQPTGNRNWSKIGLAAVVLGISGTLLFGILWSILSNWGLDQFPRLVISVCSPPAIFAAIIGTYILIVHPTEN